LFHAPVEMRWLLCGIALLACSRGGHSTGSLCQTPFFGSSARNGVLGVVSVRYVCLCARVCRCESEYICTHSRTDTLAANKCVYIYLLLCLLAHYYTLRALLRSGRSWPQLRLRGGCAGRSKQEIMEELEVCSSFHTACARMRATANE